LKHEKHGGGGAMGLSILLVAATRNPNGVQKCDEWLQPTRMLKFRSSRNGRKRRGRRQPRHLSWPSYPGGDQATGGRRRCKEKWRSATTPPCYPNKKI
jgi:hypothetical protein